MADYKVRFRQSARDDLRSILLYLVESGASPTEARRYTEMLENQCYKLAYYPHRGRSRDDIRTGLRLLPVHRRAAIAYVIEQGTVRITNIFHAGQDFETLLRTN